MTLSSPPPVAPKPGGMFIGNTFSALRHYNYRVWFIGQTMSLIGTWMQSTAQGYLLYQLTQSSAYLGYVGFLGGLPSWVFTLYAGMLGDRISRRTLLIIAQAAMMILAFILAILVFTNTLLPWHILVLAFFLGIANAFDAPTRQAFVVELVEDREDLPNAIALNAMMFNAGILVGPTVAALVYAWLGPGWCFTINGISFIAVIIALLLMRIKTDTAQKLRSRQNGAWQEIKEGLVFVKNNRIVLLLITAVATGTVFGMSLMTLMPAWAVSVLHGDVQTNGWLLSIRGAGAILGALVVASLVKQRIKGKIFTIGSILLPAVIILFSLTRTLPFSMLAIMITGTAFMFYFNTANALVQTHTPDHLRGRVMGIYTLVMFGATPLGSLLMGTMASNIGEPTAVLICGLILLVSSIILFWRVPEIRGLG